MKHLFHFSIVLFLLLSSANLNAQNVMINVLTQNSGKVNTGEIIFFEIKISNTSATKSVQPYLLRPQISFPYNLVEVPTTGHILPKGWEITANKNGVVYLTNGTDIIAENENRIILIAIKGKTKGGPVSIFGNLTFSNGIAPGSQVGPPLSGDNIADNTSTSSIIVTQ